MPKKPTFHHPLRDIRAVTGLNQKQFGQLVGVSGDTIQSIENGRLSMSKNLAIKIRRQTGCSFERITDDKGQEITTISSRKLDDEFQMCPYTKKDFDEHRQALSAIPEDIGEWVAACKQCLDLLLRAANRRNGGTTLAICEDFQEFAIQTFQNYKLSENLEGLLREEVLPDYPDMDLKLITKNFEIIPLRASISVPQIPTTISKPDKISPNPGGTRKKGSIERQATSKAKK